MGIIAIVLILWGCTQANGWCVVIGCVLLLLALQDR